MIVMNNGSMTLHIFISTKYNDKNDAYGDINHDTHTD